MLDWDWEKGGIGIIVVNNGQELEKE